MRLTVQEKKELLEMARSPKLRKDFKEIKRNRYNPFIVNGRLDIDRVIDFLTQFNDFIAHQPRPFRKIEDKKNKL